MFSFLYFCFFSDPSFKSDPSTLQAALQLSRSEVSPRRGGGNPLNGGAVNFGASTSSRQVTSSSWCWCWCWCWCWWDFNLLSFWSFVLCAKKSVLCTRVARARAGVVDGHLLLLWGSTLLLWVRPVQVPNLILKCSTIRSAVSSL